MKKHKRINAWSALLADFSAEGSWQSGLDDMELDRIAEIVESPELADPLLFFLKEEKRNKGEQHEF